MGLLPGSTNSGYSSTPSTSSSAYALRHGTSAYYSGKSKNENVKDIKLTLTAFYFLLDSVSVSSVTTGVTASASSSTAPVPEAESTTTTTTASGSNGIPFLAPDVNIHKLFQSLYDSGILSSISSINDPKKDKTQEEEENKKKIHEVDFKDPPSLKV